MSLRALKCFGRIPRSQTSEGRASAEFDSFREAVAALCDSRRAWHLPVVALRVAFFDGVGDGEWRSSVASALTWGVERSAMARC